MSAAVGAVSGARSAAVQRSNGARPAAQVATLPPPPLASLADLQDATIILMAAQVDQMGHARRQGEVRIQDLRIATEANHKKEVQALAEQREAEREARGFWGFVKKVAGTIAKVAGVVAAAAGSLFTAGATMAVAVAALALSAGAMLVRETRMFGELSDKIALGMDIGAAGLNIGSAASAIVSNTARTGAAWLRTTQNVAEMVNAGATLTAAGAGCVVASYQHDADLAQADAEDARGRIKMLADEQQMILDWLGRVAELERDAVDTTIKSLEKATQATDVAIAGVRA